MQLNMQHQHCLLREATQNASETRDAPHGPFLTDARIRVPARAHSGSPVITTKVRYGAAAALGVVKTWAILCYLTGSWTRAYPPFLLLELRRRENVHKRCAEMSLQKLQSQLRTRSTHTHTFTKDTKAMKALHHYKRIADVLELGRLAFGFSGPCWHRHVQRRLEG